MKNEELLKSMNLLDDKYISEAAPERMKKEKRFIKFGAIAACICIMVTAINLWLFLPYSTPGEDITMHESSSYYPIIEKLSAFKYTPPKSENNFDKYFGDLSFDFGIIGGADMETNGDVEEMPEADNVTSSNPDSGKYQETTDNQVDGVIEADIIKRSDKYIYYLNRNTLFVYSIEKEDSKRVATYHIPIEKSSYYYGYVSEMYLSEDCSTLTIIAPTYAKSDSALIIEIISIDVKDVENIHKTGAVRIKGHYLSSRVTDGKLLFMHEFETAHKPDYSDESTFIPQMDTGSGFESIPPENIVSPDVLTSSRYTIVSSFDTKNLSLIDTYAFLSYSTNIYVSLDSIYVTRAYGKQEKIDTRKEYFTSIETYKSTVMSDISRLAYNAGEFEYKGLISIEGSIKNQYSLDEYDGILRVVTTTNENTYENRETTSKNGNNVSTEAIIGIKAEENTSANLYCISVESMTEVASVKGFAPKGETVESVRFDKEKAYVCTAVVITLTDPVFFFDLSDINNITYTDTGKIDGFSSSLINLNNGYLLGIGQGDRLDSVKIEVYIEEGDRVVSVDKYEIKNAEYSTDYKSYFIDRENNLFGFGATIYNKEYNQTGFNSRYILLLFDGYGLVEILNVPLGSTNDNKRAVYIDGYFYMMGENSFEVINIG